MAGGGSAGNKVWATTLVTGFVLIAGAWALSHWAHSGGWLHAIMMGAGGLLVVFAACELLIKAVDGMARRVGMNRFVAGTLAGLAANVPEVVMLGFVLVATPRVGFLVTVFTLHVSAAAFGIYSALLPRDESGLAKLPSALVNLSTNQYACAGGVFFTTGAIMLLMKVFDDGTGDNTAFVATDLYVLGSALLLVQVVAIWQLIKRFGGSDEAPKSEAAESKSVQARTAPSIATILGFTLLGMLASVVGGHSVGDFADVLVTSLEQAGYPRMVGALLLSVFACAGAFVMMASAHFKRMHDVALASASGQVIQVAFTVMPLAMLMLAGFSQLGIINSNGEGVLPIDLDTVSVLFLGFPSMLILWKSVRDDGSVSWLESTTMLVIFGLALYLLAMHG